MGLHKTEISIIAIAILTTGIICGVMAFNYYGKVLPNLEQSNNAIATQHDNYSQNQLEGQSKLDEISQNITTSFPKGIICIGNDFTSGVGGDDTTYPKTLKDMLIKNIYLDDTSALCPDVQNFGISGEDNLTILGRLSVIPYILTTNLDIPKDITSIPISFISSRFSTVSPLIKSDKGLEYVSIGGIKGFITLKDNQYYFTRSEFGEPITIKSGTEIITSGFEKNQGYMPIISLNHDDSYGGIQDLISQYKQTIDKFNKDYYLIIGEITGNSESQLETEQLMQSNFGKNFINLREYLSTQALTDANLQPTQEDLNAMSIGAVPPSLLSDSTHLNSIGYDLVGKYIYNRMVELNYFNDISKYVEKYLKIQDEYKI